MRLLSRVCCAATLCAALVVSPVLLAGDPHIASPARESLDLKCGPVRSVDTGTIDYRLKGTDPAVKKGVGDLDHFHTRLVLEQMSKPRPHAHTIMDNLDFTLRHCPNHHEALGLMVRWELSGGAQLDFPGARCSLDWARKFAPEDAQVYFFGGNYFFKKGDPERARVWYEKSIELDPASAEAHYNYGLFLFAYKRYEQSRTHARLAYVGGYPLPGLRDKLLRVGYPLSQSSSVGDKKAEKSQ